ncbi:uncharacterized protein LOC141608016 [Silene latifolia]|uniref:uncharacterized protein LOC141608016 n=1 Tax=Silene latifolia TaxID=37657 RepID=UPI003D777AC8
MKESCWQDYTPSHETSWHWRKMCHVKNTIKNGFLDDIGTGEYTVKGCYNWLRERNEELNWYNSVWYPTAAPKHSFIAWLIANQALRLKDRLFSYNVVPDNLCCICALATESHIHLFQECLYTKQVLQKVDAELGAHLGPSNQLQQIKRRRWSRMRKVVTTAAIIAAWYTVWLQRNDAWLNHRLLSPSVVARQIIASLRNRLRTCFVKSISYKDGLWLSKVHLM